MTLAWFLPFSFLSLTLGMSEEEWPWKGAWGLRHGYNWHPYTGKNLHLSEVIFVSIKVGVSYGLDLWYSGKFWIQDDVFVNENLNGDGLGAPNPIPRCRDPFGQRQGLGPLGKSICWQQDSCCRPDCTGPNQFGKWRLSWRICFTRRLSSLWKNLANQTWNYRGNNLKP